MVRTFAALAAAALVISAARADDLEFKTVTSETGKFTVAMPGQPTTTSEDVDGVTLNKLVVGVGNDMAMKVVFYTQPEVKQVPDVQQFMRQLSRDYGSRVTDEREITLGERKVPGR